MTGCIKLARRNPLESVSADLLSLSTDDDGGDDDKSCQIFFRNHGSHNSVNFCVLYSHADKGHFFKVHIFLNGRRRHDLPVHKKTHIKAEQSTILPPLTNSS